MFYRLRSLITKEIIQLSRDRVLLAFTFLGPVIQIVLLGRAVGQDIRDLPVAVIDYDLTPRSREVVTALDNTEELVVAFYPDNLADAANLVDNGDVVGFVVIPNGFMQAGQSATEVQEIQVVVDGTNWLTAGRVLGAAQGALQSLAANLNVQTNRLPPGGIKVMTEGLFNQTFDFRPDAIASQLAFLTFEITTLVAVMGIVREREFGTIEMLSITPLRRLELIAGKAITPFVIGMVNFVLMLIAVLVVFEVPLRGSFVGLLALTALYLVCEIIYALLISTTTRSQQQATTVVFVWAMVAMTLSGYMVPVSTLPRVLQWVSWAVPVRHYITIVRAVMLKGASVTHLWFHALSLMMLALAMTTLTMRTLRRMIE